MRREDLFEAIGMVEEKQLAICEIYRNPSVVTHREGSKMKNGGKYSTNSKRNGMPKVWLIAAIIAAMIFLMGCAWIVRLTLASHPDYPVIDASQISNDCIHLTVSNVTNTGMHVYVSIDGFEPGSEMAIYMLQNGPFRLEKKTENGWVSVPVLVDDPEWDADRVWTDGNSDWIIDWSAVYGMLDIGTYRYIITLLEDNEPVSAEFSIDVKLENDLSHKLKAVLDGDSYYIKYTIRNELTTLEGLSKEQKELFESENAVWIYEYWKSGEDLMHLIYREDVLWVGMMYKEGIKYTLDHEGDDRTNPVIGWNQWPDMDMNRLTDWISMLTADSNAWKAEYNSDGTLIGLKRNSKNGRFDGYDLDVTYFESWEFVTGNRSETADKFAEQEVDTARVFSWAEDQKNMKPLDVKYINTSSNPISTASEAIARAKAECTVQYDKVIVHRDEKAGMWKVEFQIGYRYQGYQYIYLNDNGITQMVSGKGSKENEWKELYPDP